MQNSDLIDEITEKLKKAEPYKIILFGSYAYGIPNEESDVDILIVTTDDFIPKNYTQKSEMVLKINKLIADEKTKIPIDLIVHTKPMYQKFLSLNSSFAREVNEKGRVLYARNY